MNLLSSDVDDVAKAHLPKKRARVIFLFAVACAFGFPSAYFTVVSISGDPLAQKEKESSSAIVVTNGSAATSPVLTHVTSELKPTALNISVTSESTQLPLLSGSPVIELKQLASIAAGSVHQIAWSQDNSMLAIALFRDSIVKIYSPGLSLTRQCKGHTEGVRSVSFSSDSLLLASGGSDATVRIWTWQGALCKQVFVLAHAQPVLSVAFHPKQARLLAAGGDDGFIQLWDVSKGKSIRKWQADKQAIASLAFSSDGQFLFSGGSDSIIHIWTLEGNKVGQLVGHTGWIWDLAFDSSGELLASAGTGDLYNQQLPADNTARLWRWNERKELSVMPSGSHYVMTVAFCVSSKFLFTGSRYVTSPDRNNLRIWHTEDGSLSSELNGFKDAITSMRVSPDGKLLAVGTSSSVPWGTENIGNLIVFSASEVCAAK